MTTPYTETLRHAGSAEVMFNGYFDEPAGTIYAAVRRKACNSNTIALSTTGIPVGRLLELPAGMLVKNISVNSGGTAEVGGSHFWAAIVDVNGNVLAVTADQTGGTYVTAGTFLTNAVTAPLVIPQTGLYYGVVSVSAATTMPTMTGGPSVSGGLGGLAPVLSGTYGAQAAPPAVGANLGAITNFGYNGGFWLS